ncbi:hypothetical protein [Streptomyces piniterrae]|uniref:hypothetical protein n=1 Tax=Streptomyces piniterrae TaxID=2571125 RepID=UPI001652446E|nr:hypothetical protein [Streptomyces piniterrae]
MIIHTSANDIGASEMGDTRMEVASHVTARQLIEAHKKPIRAARARRQGRRCCHPAAPPWTWMPSEAVKRWSGEAVEW